ncbi:transposase [Pararhizobium sp. BT-229]|uniref:RNA-guided endonuclease InsQ/TnpB family protein n=1 Tax=Pararhizobium sp. BT-229 TaxID=2986923 RepID=UPI0021F74253|nr:transposase [Pararhizobium sp. BT-229]MCV9964364.1 transposase [Pararhizobium sp. BT-229]
MTNRAYKYRIYADTATEEFFARCCGVVRLVYNIALEQRSSFWRHFKRAEGKNISYPSQARELTAIRAEVPWVAECPIDAQQQALRDLNQAFQNFFSGRAGYPKPRRKFVNDAFRIPSSRVGPIEVLNAKWARVRLPKIGDVKFRYTRPIRGEVGNVTVTREANGWHVVFSCEFDHETPANDNPAVGIDRGIVNNVALSTGEMYAMPDGSALVERHKTWQRVASRRKSRSKRQAKARRHAARVAAKAARKRLHWQHVTTTRIARRFGTAVLEDLRIRNMSASAKGTVEEPGKNVAQKSGLNRSILVAAWFRFELLLTYKLAFRGGNVAKVDPRHTSVTCRECGSRDKGNRENQAKFLCLSCGHEDHADINAARNILAAGTRPAARAEKSAPRGLERAA